MVLKMFSILLKKGMGIFHILDDQVKTVGGTDKTFANDLYRMCTNHPRFSASKLQLSSRQFQLEHLAGPMQYVSYVLDLLLICIAE